MVHTDIHEPVSDNRITRHVYTARRPRQLELLGPSQGMPPRGTGRRTDTDRSPPPNLEWDITVYM